jgi:hypothetical protein
MSTTAGEDDGTFPPPVETVTRDGSDIDDPSFSATDVFEATTLPL